MLKMNCQLYFNAYLQLSIGIMKHFKSVNQCDKFVPSKKDKTLPTKYD
jgi:hypothetical protein